MDQFWLDFKIWNPCPIQSNYKSSFSNSIQLNWIFWTALTLSIKMIHNNTIIIIIIIIVTKWLLNILKWYKMTFLLIYFNKNLTNMFLHHGYLYLLNNYSYDKKITFMHLSVHKCIDFCPVHHSKYWCYVGPWRPCYQFRRRS